MRHMIWTQPAIDDLKGFEMPCSGLIVVTAISDFRLLSHSSVQRKSLWTLTIRIIAIIVTCAHASNPTL